MQVPGAGNRGCALLLLVQGLIAAQASEEGNGLEIISNVSRPLDRKSKTFIQVLAYTRLVAVDIWLHNIPR